MGGSLYKVQSAPLNQSIKYKVLFLSADRSQNINYKAPPPLGATNQSWLHYEVCSMPRSKPTCYWKRMKLENCLLDASFVPNLMRGWEKLPEKKHFRQYGSASFCLKAKNTFDERIKFLRQATKAGAQLLGLPTLSLISLAFTLGRPLNRPNPWTTFGEGCLY